ncbi:MAG: hypothetical protein ABIN68_04135, partial [Sphingomicrobium sp.]
MGGVTGGGDAGREVGVLQPVEPGYRHVLRVRLLIFWLPLAVGGVILANAVFADTLAYAPAAITLTTIPQLFLALGLAAVLNNALLKWKTGWRVGMLIPNVTSVVAVGIVFASVFGRDYG